MDKNEIAEKISSLVQSSGKSAPQMTTAISKIGGGSMEAGIQRLTKFFTDTGMDEGLKKGIEIGKSQGFVKGVVVTAAGVAVATGVYCIVTKIKNAIQNNKDEKFLKAEGEAILKVFEENLADSESEEGEHQTDNTTETFGN